MSIQSNFPNTKPSLLLDFANTKQLDNRVTFTRSTPAVYYDGRTTTMAEQNLLLQSQTFDVSPWTVANTSVTANATTAPDGTTTADRIFEDSANSAHAIYQALGTTSGSCTFSVYAKADTRSWLNINAYVAGVRNNWFDLTNGVTGTVASGCTATITSVGNGWYRCTVTTTGGSPTYFECWLATGNNVTTYAGDGTSGIYLWGAQFEARSSATAYTATTTQAITNYIPVLLTAGGNQPRFDCNPTTGESLGLLIEEQRTNIATYSSVNTSGWVSVSSTLTNNYATSPDGTTSAGYLADDTNNVQHSLYQTVTLANATSYSFSAYIKSYGRNYAEIIPFGTPTGNTVVGASFNLSNGTVSATTGAVTATITSVGNGWYRCSVIYTTVASGALNFNIFPSIGPNVGDRVYTGNGFSGLLVWGAQAEAGAFATSYIATTSASATRTADIAQMTGANFLSWYSQGFGTLYSEYAHLQDTGASTVTSPVEMNDGTQNKFFQSGPYTYAGNTANVFTRNASSLGANSTTALISRNGSTLGPYTDSAVSIGGLTQLVFGVGRIYYPFPVRIKKAAYYPIVATQAQLNALTS